MIDIDNGQNTMILEDDQGKEKEFEILFTFESDDYGKKYVLYFDPEQEDEEEIDVLFSSYDDDSLYAVEDEAEIEMISEVFNTFMEESESDTKEAESE